MGEGEIYRIAEGKPRISMASLRVEMPVGTFALLLGAWRAQEHI